MAVDGLVENWWGSVDCDYVIDVVVGDVRLACMGLVGSTFAGGMSVGLGRLSGCSVDSVGGSLAVL